MRLPLVVAVGLLGMCCLSGCVSRSTPPAKLNEESSTSASLLAQTLQDGDKVHVAVFGEEGITGTYEVDSSGTISLPLGGTIKAAHLTPASLESEIRDSLKEKFLRDPKVTVDVVSVRPFYILGEVEKPGEYPYRAGLDIWRAMALAGGQTYRASSSTVSIQRPGERQWRDYDLASAPIIEPGDVIRVPQRWF